MTWLSRRSGAWPLCGCLPGGWAAGGRGLPRVGAASVWAGTRRLLQETPPLIPESPLANDSVF